jgi:hypothetical protein
MFPLKESGATIIFMIPLYVRKYIVSSSFAENARAFNAQSPFIVKFVTTYVSQKFSFWVYFVPSVSINFTMNEEEK